MLDRLLHAGPVKSLLGLETTRGLRKLCERYQVPLLRLNRRQLAMRETDYQLLIQRMSVTGDNNVA
jgi:hypothetical protein